jgi:hypothetical protein
MHKKVVDCFRREPQQVSDFMTRALSIDEREHTPLIASKLLRILEDQLSLSRASWSPGCGWDRILKRRPGSISRTRRKTRCRRRGRRPGIERWKRGRGRDSLWRRRTELGWERKQVI